MTKKAGRLSSEGFETPYDEAEPRPAALIESLRSFGYSLQTAIADLIDNSITAGAKQIWLESEWAGFDSRITLLDDGAGMTEPALVDAMRPGSRSPLEERDENDLGRFGLGLKTASFSQCRCLTVASKTDGGRIAVRRWDLDFVARSGRWWILREATEQSADLLDRLTKMHHGTLVIWERLDRAIGLENAQDGDLDELRKHFQHAMNREVKPHLEMVFHRFLGGDARRIVIRVNETELVAWDPFRKHPARQTLPVEPISYRGSVIRPKPYIMPHKDKLTQEEHRYLSGPAGWNAQQGFYVYRKKRLLVAGSWLGLGITKDEHLKLARIQLDIPDSSGADWNIDVKKSTAHPPPRVRDHLQRVARLTLEIAEDVYRHRAGQGRRKTPEEIVRIWKQIARSGKTSYRISRDHPLVVRALAVPEQFRPAIDALLRVLEETIPIHQIWLDESKRSEAAAEPFRWAGVKEIRAITEEIYRALRGQGWPPDAARRRLEQFEFICNFPEIIAEMKE